MKSEGSFTFSCIVLDIIMWCFYTENIPGPLQSPKMLLLWKSCKSPWESAAVKGESCSCWGNQWRGCLASKLNGILAQMLGLTHQALQKGGGQFRAHGVFTSQEDGASCRAEPSPSLPPRSSLGSSGYECHLLGDEPLYINYASFIHMHVCICVYTHMLCLCMCSFAYRCTAFPETCSGVKLWNLAKAWSSSPSEDLAQACVWWPQIALGLCISGVKGKFWYCWHLMLPLFYWRQVGIFSCIAHGLWCGKLSQEPQRSDSRLAR